MSRKTLILIGGGPANLVLASQLSDHFEIHLFEKGKRVGRKFLVAGNGGFNLLNSAKDHDLTARYTRFPLLQEIVSRYDAGAGTSCNER